MRYLVAGASGFIGAALVERLRADGSEIHRVMTAPTSDGHAIFDKERGALDLSGLPGGSLSGIDAVYAVGGDPLTPRRWGPAKRNSIQTSRIALVESLARAIASATNGPKVLVSMSAIGIYGERGDEQLTERSPAGSGFVANLCRAWEGAAAPARTSGARIVAARSGIVFGPGGGFIGKLEPLFRHGLGGRLGNGRQWMSWIARTDAVEALARFATDDQFTGAVNLVAPHPLRNADFTSMLADAVDRHAPFVVPRAFLTVAAGRRVTNEFLLQSARVFPTVLSDAGFRFEFAEPDDAIRDALGDSLDHSSKA